MDNLVTHGGSEGISYVLGYDALRISEHFEHGSVGVL